MFIHLSLLFFSDVLLCKGKVFISDQLKNAEVSISRVDWVHCDLYHMSILAKFLPWLIPASSVDVTTSSL